MRGQDLYKSLTFQTGISLMIGKTSAANGLQRNLVQVDRLMSHRRSQITRSSTSRSRGRKAATDEQSLIGNEADTMTERVLFIGTQFSNLYTAVDTPAKGRVGAPH
jgi:hypothetical protein